MSSHSGDACCKLLYSVTVLYVVRCRQLCLLLNAEDVYSCCSEILIGENDVTFASHMIQTLSTILLTSSELFELRTQLKELSTEVPRLTCMRSSVVCIHFRYERVSFLQDPYDAE